MKSLILLSILVTSLIVQVYGECDFQTMMQEIPKCKTQGCRCLATVKDCVKKINQDQVNKLYDGVTKALKCGSSSLTNLGLPMILLLAVATFFNK